MMPKLPESLDNRFNFYLNYLPYIEPIGFWGCLLSGITLLVYAVTRATLKMSNLAKSSHFLELNYRRTSLLHSNRNGVYQPCMVKLINANEKSNTVLSNTGHESDDMYTELQPTRSNLPADLRSKRGSFALELEPAIESSTDSSSCDESNDSDTAILTSSQNSCTSGCHDNTDCCTEELKADSLADEGLNGDDRGGKQVSHTYPYIIEAYATFLNH